MTAVRRRWRALLLIVGVAAAVAGCGWKGLNSLPLPGTAGGGAGSYTITAQLPDVENLQRNSRVRIGDVTVGTVTKIELQGAHALVTMRLGRDVVVPGNATATVARTSLLGSLHIELAPPADAAPEGQLQNGSMIPLARGAIYPSTEQTLAATALLLNNGGIGEINDITRELAIAFTGREADLRSLIDQLDTFIGHLNDQTDDIISATDSLNQLVGQFAAQQPVLDRALTTIPEALAVLKEQRHNLAQAIDQFGKFSALVADSTRQTKDSLVAEFNQLAPVLESLGNAGPALTRSLSMLATYPWPNETLENMFRGDYANLTAIIDLTLSRIDASVFTGTRFEGDLTELELQWGRTIGQFPSPYTAGNPLTVPYRFDQGR